MTTLIPNSYNNDITFLFSNILNTKKFKNVRPKISDDYFQDIHADFSAKM